MILESSKLKLEEISTVRLTPVCNCLICKDLRMEGATLYTVLQVRDHEVIHALLTLYGTNSIADSPLVDFFSSADAQIFVFPWRKERPLLEFYVGDVMPLTQCEDICINVILACMTSGLPWPILYLVLRQRLLNLNRDDSVYLSYSVDLTELDLTKHERDCVEECADILMLLLESKSSQKADSYQLLGKKIASRSYNKFTELYRDVRLAAAPKGRKGILYRIRCIFARHRDTLFGILFWVCLILGIVALAMLISHLTLGDIPWLRLFLNTFKQIGTESLLQ
ncbi:MAG: hypothetical protein IJT34_01360 [Butyrivibrio sp.]|nr:hypothetical protein [Butyrivibrio sp.]